MSKTKTKAVALTDGDLPKKTTITVVLGEHLYSRLETIAKSADRSMGGYLRRLFQEHLGEVQEAAR